MSEPLDSLLKDVENRVRAKDPTAIERAKQLAEKHPDEPEVWHLLAFAHSMNDDLDGAVAAMNRLAAIAPPEPAMFYLRGDYEHNRGNLEAALADLNQAIAPAKQEDEVDEDDMQDLYFRRADVLVGLGRKAEARADLAHVRDGFAKATTRLRTKDDILADCEG